MFDREFGNECIIVDPGSRSEKKLIDYLDGDYLNPKYIILTHEHFDHCWGVNELVERYHIPIVCSEICAKAIKNKKKNCSVFYDSKDSFTINKETVTIEELNDDLKFGNSTILFFNTPGHTDASLCFSIGRFLFTGDTLIKDEYTVTKLPTGSLMKLKESILKLICFKGKGLIVYPGHGVSFLFDDYNPISSIKGNLP